MYNKLARTYNPSHVKVHYYNRRTALYNTVKYSILPYTYITLTIIALCILSSI